MPKVIKPVKVAVIGVLLIAVGLVAMDLKLRYDFAQISSASTRLVENIPKADGVVEVRNLGGNYNNYGNNEVRYGNGLIATLEKCYFGVTCPSAHTTMLVLIQKDKENDFVASLLNMSGYESRLHGKCYPFRKYDSTCYVQASNSYSRVSIGINVADSFHHGAPAQDSATTDTWRYIVIDTERYIKY